MKTLTTTKKLMMTVLAVFAGAVMIVSCGDGDGDGDDGANTNTSQKGNTNGNPDPEDGQQKVVIDTMDKLATSSDSVWKKVTPQSHDTTGKRATFYLQIIKAHSAKFPGGTEDQKNAFNKIKTLTKFTDSGDPSSPVPTEKEYKDADYFSDINTCLGLIKDEFMAMDSLVSWAKTLKGMAANADNEYKSKEYFSPYKQTTGILLQNTADFIESFKKFLNDAILTAGKDIAPKIGDTTSKAVDKVESGILNGLLGADLGNVTPADIDTAVKLKKFVEDMLVNVKKIKAATNPLKASEFMDYCKTLDIDTVGEALYSLYKKAATEQKKLYSVTTTVLKDQKQGGDNAKEAIADANISPFFYVLDIAKTYEKEANVTKLTDMNNHYINLHKAILKVHTAVWAAKGTDTNKVELKTKSVVLLAIFKVFLADNAGSSGAGPNAEIVIIKDFLDDMKDAQKDAKTASGTAGNFTLDKTTGELEIDDTLGAMKMKLKATGFHYS